MSTHTFEIIQPISLENMMNALTLFNFSKWNINRFITSKKKVDCIRKKMFSTLPGFKQIVFVKNSTDFPLPAYYCIIRIEPLSFILKRRTVDVFECTEDNIRSLKYKFHQTMTSFLDESLSQYTSLKDWNCLRIDYTKNLQFESLKQVHTFLLLTKKTSQYIRRKRLELSRKSFYDSTAEGNKSSKFIIYNKWKQIFEGYNDIPTIEKEQLLHEAVGIARLEVQCKKGKVQTMSKHLSDKKILNYLNENIATKIIHQYYEKTVHYGNFYSFYHAKKIIKNSSMNLKIQEQLIHFLQLIAQSRHLDTAKENFLAGTKIKRTGIVVKGSINTFRTRVQELSELNINPILLSKESKIKFFPNPLQPPLQNEI